MSRHKIAREGFETLDRRIEIGALWWETSKDLLVMWNYEWDLENIMGKATDLQREDDGWISAEITWSPIYQDLIDLELNKTIFLSIYADQLDHEQAGRLELVKSARLRSVVAVAGADPWVEVTAPSGADAPSEGGL